MRYSVHVGSTKPCHWVWKYLWPSCCVSPSLPNPPSHSGGGSPQTDFAGQQGSRLAVCLCTDEWCHVPCASVQWGTHWCYDRWCTQCEHLQPSPSVTNTEVTTMWGSGGLPWGAKWGAQSSTVWGATTLECSHCRWTHPRSTTDGGGPQWCGTWGYNNYPSGYQHHTGTTLFLATEPPYDIIMAINWHLWGALEWLQWTSPTTSAPSLSTVCTEGGCHLQPWGLSPPPEQKIHSAWRGWTWPSQIWWPPLHRYSHMWSSQKASLASSQSVTHCAHLPYWKLWRWPESPPFHSHWLPPGQSQPICLMRCFDSKGR